MSHGVILNHSGGNDHCRQPHAQKPVEVALTAADMPSGSTDNVLLAGFFAGAAVLEGTTR
jgi:hypothetical protein